MLNNNGRDKGHAVKCCGDTSICHDCKRKRKLSHESGFAIWPGPSHVTLVCRSCWNLNHSITLDTRKWGRC